MAHQLTGKTIASTFEQLWYRGTTEPGGTTNAVQVLASENDQTDDIGTALYIGTERVGIGTSAPGAVLELRNTTSSSDELASTEYNLWLRNNSTDNDDCVGLAFLPQSDDGSIKGSIVYKATAGYNRGQIQFLMDNTADSSHVAVDDDAIMVINKDGNVGIGTITPEYDLEIKGGAADDATTGGGQLALVGTDAALNAAGDDIGTIYFIGSDTSASSNKSVGAMIMAESDGAWDNASSNDAPSSLQFYTQSGGTGNGMASPRMHIDLNGNVGIGTAAPESILNLFADESVTDTHTQLTITTENNGPDYHPMIVMQKMDEGEDKVALNDKLGMISFRGWDDDSSGEFKDAAKIVARVDAAASDGYVPGRLQFQTAFDGEGTTNKMTIKHTGNIGIGTDDPESLLDVRGIEFDTSCVLADPADPTITHADDNGKIQVGMAVQGTGIPANSYVGVVAANHLSFELYKGGTEENTTQTGAQTLTFSNPGVLTISTASTEVDVNDEIGIINFQAPEEDVGGDGVKVCASIQCAADVAFTSSVNSASLRFFTDTDGDGPYERMRIDQDGYVGIGTGAPGYLLDVESADGNNTFLANFENLDTSDPEGIRIKFAADYTSASITDDRVILYADSDSDNFIVYSDGGVHADESDHVSDIRLKENIVDASAKLEDINQLKVRNFNYKGKDATEAKRIGFIADEIETVFPKIIKQRAIRRNGVDYTDLKMIRYEPLIAMLVKAVQELSAKVTALEGEDSSSDTKIAALEAKDTASEAKIAALESEDTANKAKVAVLETEDTANKAKIVALEAKDVEYAATITALTARITALESA